jgi:Bacteriophage HK97-gp10, putative tail-component
VAKPAVRIEGLRELRSALRVAERGLKTTLSASLRRAAVPAADLARARAPRHSGRLASSVQVKATTTGAAVGSPLVYAPVIEFAHKVTVRSGRRRYVRRVRPQPFVRPSVEASEEVIGRGR